MTQRRNLIGRWRSVLRPFRFIPGVLHGARRSAAALPDLVDAILVLPSIARHLEIITFQTATLVDMREELINVRANTAPLPHLDTELANVNEVLCRVDLNTQAVQQLADVVLPLHGAAARVGRFADRWPSRRVEGRPAPGSQTHRLGT